MKLYLQKVCIILLSVFSTTVNAQSIYHAGAAQASVEPTSFPFSLSLAGYGVPREGRFTLDWIRKGVAESCTAFTGVADKLYAIRNGQLWVASAAAGETVWKSIGKANDMTLLAGAGKELYAVDNSGNIFCSKVRGRIKWSKIGKIENAVAIAVLDDFMYAVNRDGTVLYSPVSRKIQDWEKLTHLAGARSLAAYKGSLYALTAADDLLKFDLAKKDDGWLKIGRYNGTSYDVNLQSIAVANNTLFGLDKGNTVFMARHLTKGDLMVSALAVAEGKQTVVVVGADLCGFDHHFIKSIKAEVFRKHGVPAAAVLINASHTHFAPVTQQWTTWGEHNQQPDSIYLHEIVKPAILLSIESAIKSMAPSELYFGRGKTAIGGNRALTESPVPYDNDVDVVNVIRKADGKRTVLFLAGCHPVERNEGAQGYTISANFPGVTRAALSKDATIANALFIQGCGGDINPKDDYVTTGEKLASDVRSVLGEPMKKLEGQVSFFLDSVSFPVERWTNDQIMAFRQENSAMEGNVYAEKNVRWADLMLRFDQENKMPATMPVYIQTINIGDWKLVGLSREAVTEYSLGIKQIWPEHLVSVAGYCNDVSSYLPTERHIKAGGYEGLDSSFWYGQPSVFPASVHQIILKRIKSQNH